MRLATLPRPRRFDDEHGPTMWVDEAIWGHRLHDEQTPWLAFLEFLNVLQSEARSRAIIHGAQWSEYLELSAAPSASSQERLVQ